MKKEALTDQQLLKAAVETFSTAKHKGTVSDVARFLNVVPSSLSHVKRGKQGLTAQSRAMLERRVSGDDTVTLHVGVKQSGGNTVCMLPYADGKGTCEIPLLEEDGRWVVPNLI